MTEAARLGQGLQDRASEQRSHSSGGFSELGGPGRIVEHACRQRQSVMLAQRHPGILGAEQSTALQKRDHPTAKRIQLGRQQRRHDIESVRCAGSEPVFDQIGDLLRSARGDIVSARAGQITKQLPQCRPVPPNQVDDDLSAAARRLDRLRAGKVLRRERPVERQMREIVAAETCPIAACARPPGRSGR